MDSIASYSGIKAIGEIKWGTHFCNFYRTQDDLIDSLIPYFQAGLNNNEQCIWITSDPLNSEDARTALNQIVMNLPELLHNKQIEIIDYRDWYLKTGKADSETILNAWIQRQHQALAKGYKGLRVSGNTFWLEEHDWQNFGEYEAKVSQAFSDHRIIALCSYCLDRCHPEHILHVVRNHQYALIRNNNDWELIETSSLKIAKEELNKLNENLEVRITERTHELEQALNLRDQFLSIASHELKTPITALQLYVDGLIRGQQHNKISPEEINNRLHNVREQCLRLENLINNLLDVSKVSIGILQIEPQKINFSELIYRVLERFNEELQRVNISCKLELDNTINGHWDPLRLDQVLSNLIANAIKYAPGKPVTITLRKEQAKVLLEIADQGIGIALAEQEKIFDRFVQITPSSNHSGFGLGLWIVRQIARAQGGEVSVQSEIGKGSTFTVELPLNL